MFHTRHRLNDDIKTVIHKQVVTLLTKFVTIKIQTSNEMMNIWLRKCGEVYWLSLASGEGTLSMKLALLCILLLHLTLVIRFCVTTGFNYVDGRQHSLHRNCKGDLFLR